MDFNSLGLLIIRLGFGLSMALCHGLPKLLDFSNKMHTFPDPIGVGSVASYSLVVFAEFFCALAIVIGLFTRFATAPLIIAMAVACFVVHGADPFAKKEMAFLYMVAFTAILSAGAGRFSADAIFRRKN